MVIKKLITSCAGKLCGLTLLGVLIVPLFFTNASARTTSVHGETFTWDFQGIPPANITELQSCYTNNGWDVCPYKLTDPPYGDEITFLASVNASGAFPNLTFLYYDSFSNANILDGPVACGGSSCLLQTGASFFIPGNAVKFSLLYHNNSGKQIALEFHIANDDPVRANLFAGDDINRDTEYCETQPQPGEPRIKKFRNRKGAGPGT